MVNFVKDLLLHFSIILFLGLIYNFVYMQKLHIRPRPVFIASVFLSLLLTASFPVQFEGGFEYDMKFLPVFISFFYIGPAATLALIGLLILYTALFGSVNIFVTILNYTIVFLFFYLIKRQYKETTIMKKVLMAFSVYFVITVTRLVVLVNGGNAGHLPHLLVFTLVSFLALAMTIYIIEMTDFQRKMVIELHKAEKLSAISQLAASVAHEVRNPITTIKGFMQVLLGEKNLTDNQMMYINISLQELGRTQTIINNFLSMARPNTHQENEIDMTLLLKEITEFMKPYSHYSNIEILEQVEEGLKIKADSHEVRQIIVNLIKNGVEAMPNGGKFYIRADNKGEYIQIQIQDEGIGMTKKQLSKLGSPYYSTKEKGTGLGLMICYDIIYRMNGKILVDSEEGKGTTFTLLIPAAA
jgi:two-component system, sporulation sensor kinase B